jgi:hypothetical protein
MSAAWEIIRQRLGQEKIAILVPHTGSVSTAWAVNFRSLQMPPGTRYFFGRGTPWDVARNNLVREALDIKADWVFFWDSDILLKPDAMLTLLAHRLPIVSGLYWAKKQTGPTLAAWLKRGDGYAPIATWAGRMIRVDVVGMGCCLIHADVFRKVQEPWFKWTSVSEDFYFCENAAKAGFSIHVDTQVVGKHIGVFEIDEGGAIKALEV